MKEKYKMTEVGLIPEDWEVIRIEDVCKLINGRGFKPHEWQKQGLPIIRIQNLNGSEEFNFYLGPYDKKIEIENGQLLFAWSGSRGTSFGPHVWRGERGVLNYHTWKIEVDENAIDLNYFLHALKQLTKYIEDQAHGALYTQLRNIPRKQLRNIPKRLLANRLLAVVKDRTSDRPKKEPFPRLSGYPDCPLI